jgi:hypothetical protein
MTNGTAILPRLSPFRVSPAVRGYVVISALLLALLIPVAATGTTTSSKATVSTCSVGKLARLRKDRWGARSKTAYDKIVAAVIAGDTYGANRLLYSGAFVLVDRGSLVRVLSHDFTHVSVRVLRSPNPRVVNLKLWFDCSWLGPA